MTITGEVVFFGLLLLGVFLTMFTNKRRDILLALSASLTWFALGMWLFFSTTHPLGLAEGWQQVLVWVFFILCFVPMLLYMNQEIIREKSGNRWSEYGDPKDYESTVSAYDKYKKDLQRRLRQ